MSRAWSDRVIHKPRTLRELEELEQAAEHLENQAGRRAPATSPVFKTVTSILLIGTAALTATLAGLHLYDRLTRTHPARREDQPPEREAKGNHPAAQRLADAGHQDAEQQRRRPRPQADATHGRR